jgi:ATP-dependent RNA helicase RhlE
MSDFTGMNLAPELVKALATMKITMPTEVQTEAIPIALAGADLIAVAQTGSGKTLAYALSVVTLLVKKPEARALILSPNRETAEQVYRVLMQICAELKLSIVLAATGQPVDKQANQLKKNPRIVVATPGRMSEQLRANKLLLKGLEFLVIDEADRMLDEGFEDQLKFIHSTLRGERQTLMFAASFGSWAEPVAKYFLKSDPVLIRSKLVGTPVAGLRQKVFYLKEGQKENRLLDELKRMKGGVIVFAGDQETCVSLGRLLEHHRFSCEFVHGEMNAGHRSRVLREFREEKKQILVTTDLLARGLDIPTIKFVISYDLPYRGEEFLHRIGRTARAGNEGDAVTFVTPADGRTYRRLKQYLVGATEEYLTKDFKFSDRE